MCSFLMKFFFKSMPSVIHISSLEKFKDEIQNSHKTYAIEGGK